MRLKMGSTLMVALLVFGGVALDVSIAPPPAHAQDEQPDDPVGEATRLKDEAREWFNQSGDMDLSHKERKAARREAFFRLKNARKYLDDYLDANPGETESLDSLYVEIAAMMYWVKKEASVNEFGPERPGKSAGAGGKKPPAKKPAGPAAGPKEPETGKAPEPEGPKPPTAREVLDDIETYARRYPGDVPGLHERYVDFLGRFPDRSTPEYEAALGQVQDLGKRLKDVYRLARDEDPDALKNVDDEQVLKLVRELSVDLAKGDQPVRLRAARYLGGLGSGEAAVPLITSLKKEKDDEVREAAQEALSKVGGTRVTRRLAKIKPKSKLGPAVVEIFEQTVARGGVNARIAGAALVDYVSAFDEERQHAAIEVLAGAGKDGALGLAKGLGMAPRSKRAEYIEQLGKSGEPRVAGPLAETLRTGASGAEKKRQKAARAAIRELGVPGVRYLIPVLDDPQCNVWTAKLLRDLTGADPKDDKRKTWEKWYRRNRKKLAAK